MPIIIIVAVAIALVAISSIFWPNSVERYQSAEDRAIQMRSLEIDKVLLLVDTSSLPIQEFEDQTFVFSSAVEHLRNTRPVSTADAR